MKIVGIYQKVKEIGIIFRNAKIALDKIFVRILIEVFEILYYSVCREFACITLVYLPWRWATIISKILGDLSINNVGRDLQSSFLRKNVVK
jgi:hypothetical protein